ncbi:amino acid ABC transporter substrate-binding protein, PAAT family [Alkalispirochaeta americana]|uniref:Amino acid ABC transporter substrate-binding protein, PAAT family n=1 Tax=Alkalispirochaeta americana TaxID=159291 RepID=A0A1N6N647_9SPIO|nr:transporter substrate-binding domain-containing protein [Alkalispirochaeta americana]SIP87530.1 amino acid ABC transporter substrate-binding protein, PAAT family [Alkalispirochaeta americana]
MFCAMLFSGLLVCLAPLGAIQEDSRQVIRLGVDDFPPYISRDQPGYGVLAEIITEVFAQAGLEVRYLFMPWNRALLHTEEGDLLEGTPGWFRTPQREEVFLVSDPIVSDCQSFFHLKDRSISWNTVEDLKGFVIGATRGYDYGAAFMKAREEGTLDVEWVSRDIYNFRKLLLGRIDLFPMNTLAGYSLLGEHFPPEEAARVTHHDTLLRSQDLHLLLSRNPGENRTRLEQFNRGLQELRQSGRHAELLQQANVPVSCPHAD